MSYLYGYLLFNANPIKNRIRVGFEINTKTIERSSCTNFEFFIDRKIGLKIKKNHHLISDVSNAHRKY